MTIRLVNKCVGEEPDSPTASWNLPPLSKHTSTANVQSAESLSDDRARTVSEGWKQYDLLHLYLQSVHQFTQLQQVLTSCADPCRPKDHANFFATTKFFSCLDLAESQELLELSQMVSWFSFAKHQITSSPSSVAHGWLNTMGPPMTVA